MISRHLESLQPENMMKGIQTLFWWDTEKLKKNSSWAQVESESKCNLGQVRPDPKPSSNQKLPKSVIFCQWCNADVARIGQNNKVDQINGQNRFSQFSKSSKLGIAIRFHLCTRSNEIYIVTRVNWQVDCQKIGKDLENKSFHAWLKKLGQVRVDLPESTQTWSLLSRVGV